MSNMPNSAGGANQGNLIDLLKLTEFCEVRNGEGRGKIDLDEAHRVLQGS